MFSSTLTLPEVNLDWFGRSCSEVEEILEQHHKEAWSNEEDPVTGIPWMGDEDLKETGSMMATTVFKCSTGLGKMFGALVSKPYGKYHQYGTKHIPMRRWLGLNTSMIDQIESVFVKHVFSSIG